MPIKFRFENVDKGAWILLRQAYNLIFRCEDRVFGAYNLSTEQHTVLMTVKNISGPVRITDIARWLDRSVNSVSMIIDRMVKAGLVKRTRDRKDRRTVFVTLTNKAEEAYVPATTAGWELVQEILSPLSNEDKRTLIRLLETIRDKTYDYLEPGAAVEEVKVNGTKKMKQFMEQASKYNSSSTPEAKRQSGKKRKL
ncbi:MAG: winged helix-turn-helix transcriptional regulator [Dehalococcoidales bacterium]|nr:winged helix-turn-helix transcriptional regulator [Dehalococcoidales bacterium]